MDNIKGLFGFTNTEYKILNKLEDQKKQEILTSSRVRVQRQNQFRELHKTGGTYQIYCPECGSYSYFTYTEKLQLGATNPFSSLECHNCKSKQCIIMEKVGDRFVK